MISSGHMVETASSVIIIASGKTTQDIKEIYLWRRSIVKPWCSEKDIRSQREGFKLNQDFC